MRKCCSRLASFFFFANLTWTIFNFYHYYVAYSGEVIEGLRLAQDCALESSRNLTLCSKDAYVVGSWLGEKTKEEISSLHEFWIEEKHKFQNKTWKKL